ncbi:hypothetical protein KXD40_000297 [Peronospora effusa]|nr:hypothetical protein KXD40_000297 [Peronospora effusa]
MTGVRAAIHVSPLAPTSSLPAQNTQTPTRSQLHHIPQADSSKPYLPKNRGRLPQFGEGRVHMLSAAIEQDVSQYDKHYACYSYVGLAHGHLSSFLEQQKMRAKSASSHHRLQSQQLRQWMSPHKLQHLPLQHHQHVLKIAYCQR